MTPVFLSFPSSGPRNPYWMVSPWGLGTKRPTQTNGTGWGQARFARCAPELSCMKGGKCQCLIMQNPSGSKAENQNWKGPQRPSGPACSINYWENWGPETGSTLTKVTQQVHDPSPLYPFSFQNTSLGLPRWLPIRPFMVRMSDLVLWGWLGSFAVT